MAEAQPAFKIADLCDAATDGDVSRVKLILDQQPDLVNVMVAEDNEHRAIHFAVMNGHDDAVRLLVQRGAIFEAGIYPHREATGALTIAQERGLDSIVDIIRDEDEKLKLAACENIEISPENDGLFAAVTEKDEDEALRLLDAHPELLNACHRNGGSVLYAAACVGLYNLVHQLLERGADYRHLTPGGASPLDGAVQNAHPRALPLNEGCLIAAGLLLQAGCGVSLETAVALGDLPHVRQAAADRPERFVNDGVRRLGLLQRAVEADNVEMLKLLLALGCHPDDEHELAEYENRPKSGGEPLTKAAGSGQHEIAEILLEAGADPNKGPYASGNPVGQAPLGWAARWDRYELAELYLENGADPGRAGATWSTPLAWADKRGNDRLTELIRRYI